MRTALVTPYSTGHIRGNIVTVRRIAHHLGAAGADTLILGADTLSPEQMERQIAEFRPDIIHAFHALYCGVISRFLARKYSLPYLVTITGSDIWEPSLRNNHDTAASLADATIITCFDETAAAEVARHFPAVRDRIIIVPQGVEPLPVSGESIVNLDADAIVLLLPASLRPVKNVEFCIRAMEPLLRDNVNLHLLIAGGAIDVGYAVCVAEAAAAVPRVILLGEVPHEHMGDMYALADLVLNCSCYEAMPNSLLEAMALGRAVLASDIPGNRSLVTDGDTGFLYRDEEDFRRKALRLIGDASLRLKLGNEARERVLSLFAPVREAKQYLELYRV